MSHAWLNRVAQRMDCTCAERLDVCWVLHSLNGHFHENAAGHPTVSCSVHVQGEAASSRIHDRLTVGGGSTRDWTIDGSKCRVLGSLPAFEGAFVGRHSETKQKNVNLTRFPGLRFHPYLQDGENCSILVFL